MKRICSGNVLLGGLLALLGVLALSGPAVAAQDCGRIEDPARDFEWTVASWNTACVKALKLGNRWVKEKASFPNVRATIYPIGFTCSQSTARSRGICTGKFGRRRVWVLPNFAGDVTSLRPPKPRIPRLRRGQAWRYMRTALRREYGNGFRHGYAKRVKCRKRVRRTAIRCTRISWVIGDMEFVGKGTIWIDRRLWWNYSFRIREINGYCLAIGGSWKQCTSLKVVR